MGDVDPHWLDEEEEEEEEEEEMGGFPPKLSDYRDANFSKEPTVTVEKTRPNTFEQ